MEENQIKEGKGSTAEDIPHTDYFNRTKNLWLIVLIASTALLLVVGFGFGYLYAAKVKGLEDPIVYGIQKLNKYNNAHFQCECRDPQFSNYYRYNEDGRDLIDSSPYIQNPLLGLSTFLEDQHLKAMLSPEQKE